MPGFHPQLLAFLRKQGVRLPSFELGVTVIGTAQARFHCAETGPGLQPLSFEVQALGPHADTHIVFSYGAVVAAVADQRGAQAMAFAKMAETDRPAVGRARGVADASRGVERPRTLAREQHRHPHIVMMPIEGVQVESPVALTGLQQGRRAALTIAGGGLQQRLSLQALDTLARQTVVDDVDGTANRAAAIQQRSRPPKHLDAVHCQHIDRHRMVRTQG